MQSQQPGAQHAQNSGHDRGLQEKPPCSPPLTIINSTVTAVESFRFLGTTISQELKWDIQIDSIVKKAQQRLYFLRQLRKFNLPQELLKQFYSAIIESILCTSITVWFSSATKSDLRRVDRTAERIIGTTLPTLQELYLSRVSKRTGKNPSGPLTSSTLPLWTIAVIILILKRTKSGNDRLTGGFLCTRSEKRTGKVYSGFRCAPKRSNAHKNMTKCI